MWTWERGLVLLGLWVANSNSENEELPLSSLNFKARNPKPATAWSYQEPKVASSMMAVFRFCC